MGQQDKGVRRFLLLSALLCVYCVPPLEAVFGIPEFLEYGVCANVTLVEDFDPVKYTGLWFDIASVPNEYQQTKACVTHKYLWKDDHMGVVTRGLSETEQKIRQSIVFLLDEEVQPPSYAHMKVIAEGMPESPYQVISTDYRNYACVYSCLEYFGFRAEFFWLYGRTPTLSESYANRCYNSLTAMGVDHTKMTSIRQGETCPYIKKLDQLLKTNNALMRKTIGPELPTETPTTPSTTTTTTSPTTRPPTTTIPATTPPPTTTPVTTIPPTTTPVITRPPTTIIPAATNPPTTNTPATTNPPTTTPTPTRPPTTASATTTQPATTTSTISSPPTSPADVQQSTIMTTAVPRPRPSFTLTSGRAAYGIPPEAKQEETAQDMDEEDGQEEEITASRQQTVLSNAKEVTPSSGTWRRDQEMTQGGSTAGMTSDVGPVALLAPLLAVALSLLVLL